MSDTPGAFQSPDIQKLISRMRRIEGQARGIQRMLEEGRTCEDIVTQLAAMRAALAKVAMAVVASRFDQCFTESMTREEAMQEASRLLMKFG